MKSPLQEPYAPFEFNASAVAESGIPDCRESREMSSRKLRSASGDMKLRKRVIIQRNVGGRGGEEEKKTKFDFACEPVHQVQSASRECKIQVVGELSPEYRAQVGFISTECW